MNKNKPLALSVIIPAYNEEGHIKACLDSIAEQTVMPFEVIVVDNNSKDKTVQVAQAYPFVRIVNAQLQGIVHARDAGFNSAQGDIICRIDADSILDKNWVATCQEYFEDNPDVSAITGHCYFYDFPFKRFVQAVHHAFYYGIQRAISGTEILWGSNMALRREAWLRVRDNCLTVARTHEDIDLSLHLQDSGLQIKRVASLVAGVSMRRGDITPGSLIKYLWPWPRTYWVNKRYTQAIAITYLLSVILVLVLPISLIALAISLLAI